MENKREGSRYKGYTYTAKYVCDIMITELPNGSKAKNEQCCLNRRPRKVTFNKTFPG